MTKCLAWISVTLVVSTSFMSPLLGQVDSGTLRARYGAPAEEVFDVRPGVTMTVSYGDNHQACKLEIRSARNASAVIPAPLVQQLLDEILPPSIRATPKGQFLHCAGAICWTLSEYESMSMGHAVGDVTPSSDNQTQSSLATIRFKPCQSQVDSGSLPARYGPPEEESFGVRPGLTMAVSYGKNHQACKIDLRPTNEASAIPAVLIEQLVDEVVPSVIRGAIGRRSGNCNGGCWMDTEYDNLRIGQERGNPATDDGGGTVTLNPDVTKRSSLAVIEFKSCKAPKQ